MPEGLTRGACESAAARMGTVLRAARNRTRRGIVNEKTVYQRDPVSYTHLTLPTKA